MKKRSISAVLIAASLVLVACGDDKDDATTTAASETTAAEAVEVGDIVAVASANPDFSTLVAAVSAAGLVETLQGAGPFTVFAPTNEAFAALPAGLVDKLLLFVAPTLSGVGPGLTDALDAPLTLSHLRSCQVGDDVLLEAYLRDP